uniref:Uncharacterized protein n=1 Tax=Arundo donax TaxID=35708 RepID=A0A0A9F4K7_ARUDO
MSICERIFLLNLMTFQDGLRIYSRPGKVQSIYLVSLPCQRVHQLHLQLPNARKVIKVKESQKGAPLGSYWSSHSCQNFLYLPIVKMHHQWQYRIISAF